MSQYYKPVNGVDNGDDVRTKGYEALRKYREQAMQYAANFQAPDKTNSVFTASPQAPENRNTVFGG